MALSTFSAAELSRIAGFSYSNVASKAVADKLNAIISAIGATPNWGAPVADITALKAVAAADRANGQSRVVQDNGFVAGADSIYVFDSASAATESLPEIVAPTAGTGRWILAFQDSIDLYSGQAPAADSVASAVGPVSTAFATKYTVGANKLRAGSQIKVVAGGLVTAGSGAINLNLTLKIGSVVIGAKTVNYAPNTNETFRLEATLVFSAVGAGGAFSSTGLTIVGPNTFATPVNHASALDTTAARDITVLVDWAAGAGESVRLDVLSVELDH